MDRFTTNEHSELYAKYRPSTPPAVVDFILSYLEERLPKINGSEGRGPAWETAVDVGCGSGQSTRVWSEHFNQVHGFDVSQSQIEEAKRAGASQDNVKYAISPAESLPLPSNSVDLVVVSQAIHWFDKDKFYSEAGRILKPNGVLAVYRYTDVEPICKGKSLSPVYAMRDTHPLIVPHMPETVREEQDKGLTDLVLPFRDRRRGEKLPFSLEGTMDYFVGLIRTRSAFQELHKANEEQGRTYLEDTIRAAKDLIGVEEDEEFFQLKIHVNYYYAVELGRK